MVFSMMFLFEKREFKLKITKKALQHHEVQNGCTVTGNTKTFTTNSQNSSYSTKAIFL
jgi:hypothetical protein